MKEYCFGIDVGGTTVKMGLFRVDGELLEKWEIPSRTENEGKAILPDIAEAVQKKLEERGIEKYRSSGADQCRGHCAAYRKSRLGL